MGQLEPRLLGVRQPSKVGEAQASMPFVEHRARHAVGERARVGRLGLPTLVVQEGGYSVGNLRSGARAFFTGLASTGY